MHSLPTPTSDLGIYLHLLDDFPVVCVRKLVQQAVLQHVREDCVQSIVGRSRQNMMQEFGSEQGNVHRWYSPYFGLRK